MMTSPTDGPATIIYISHESLLASAYMLSAIALNGLFRPINCGWAGHNRMLRMTCWGDCPDGLNLQ